MFFFNAIWFRFFLNNQWNENIWNCNHFEAWFMQFCTFSQNKPKSLSVKLSNFFFGFSRFQTMIYNELKRFCLHVKNTKNKTRRKLFFQKFWSISNHDSWLRLLKIKCSFSSNIDAMHSTLICNSFFASKSWKQNSRKKCGLMEFVQQ